MENMENKPTQHSLTWTVTDDMCAKRIGTAGAKILSTPNMLALMEACALELARRGELTSAAKLAPVYHRLSQAERERLAKLNANTKE